MWIQRDISKILTASHDPIQIIRGPRQCGKTSLILQLDPEFKEVSLDDLHLRNLAQNDPNLFLKQFGSNKIFIDEAQYAPQLFPALKRKIDLYKRESNKIKTIVRITGSNQILMDKNVKESLAGRASYFDMNTLSISEILSSQTKNIQDILYMGGWPELYSRGNVNPKKYIDDYISSYIEKDIVLTSGIQKSTEFLKFVKLLAGRVGEILDFASLAKDTGVDSKTIKDWISILERMHIIALVQPYSNNLSTRLIKSPKVFFIDTGLACRLQGWTSSETILVSPQQGHLFENLVFSEIYKMNINHQYGFEIFHWRSKDGEEIDFLIRHQNDNLFVEAKVSSRPIDHISQYREVKKVFKNKIPEILLCHQEGQHVLEQQVPIQFLSSKIKSHFKL